MLNRFAFLFERSDLTSQRQGRYPNFDILRLFLASEVAFVHSWWTVDRNFQWQAYIMAVPAFLAISGFLVLQSYAETGSWRVFIKKRALRILPALMVSLILCAVLFDWHMAWNSFLNWISGGLYTWPGRANGPLWSLAWEELAYLCLALLWAVGAYRRPIWIWCLFGLSLMVIGITNDIKPHTRVILFLAPAFFIGNLMFLYRKRLLDVHPIVPWVAFYIMLQWRFVPDSSLINGASLLIFQAFAVVWAGMAGLKVIPFKFPDISYSVYIYHMPIVLFIASHYRVMSLQHLLLMVAIALIPLCLVSWYLVEKPALSFKNRGVSRKKERVCSPAA